MLKLSKCNALETGFASLDGFDPDRKQFALLEELGFLKFFAAKVSGQIIGYAIFMVHKHMHYPKKIVALQDSTYFKPEYRGFTAGKFLMWVDSQLKTEATSIIRQVTDLKDYSRSLLRLGYRQVETSFIKEF